MYTGYIMQSIAHLVWVIWKATLSFVKKHVSYTWIVSSAMLGGQKGGFVRTPSNPPCVRACNKWVKSANYYYGFYLLESPTCLNQFLFITL